MARARGPKGLQGRLTTRPQVGPCIHLTRATGGFNSSPSSPHRRPEPTRKLDTVRALAEAARTRAELRRTEYDQMATGGKRGAQKAPRISRRPHVLIICADWSRSHCKS